MASLRCLDSEGSSKAETVSVTDSMCNKRVDVGKSGEHQHIP